MFALNESPLFQVPSKGLDLDGLTDQLITMDLWETEWLLLAHGDKIIIDFPMETRQYSRSQTTS